MRVAVNTTAFLNLDALPGGKKQNKNKNARMSFSQVRILDDFAVPQPSITVFYAHLSFCQGERGLTGLPGEAGEKGEPGEVVVGLPVSMRIYRLACPQHLLFTSTYNENLDSCYQNVVDGTEYKVHLWLKTLSE